MAFVKNDNTSLVFFYNLYFNVFLKKLIPSLPIRDQQRSSVSSHGQGNLIKGAIRSKKSFTNGKHPENINAHGAQDHVRSVQLLNKAKSPQKIRHVAHIIIGKKSVELKA